VNSLKTGSSVAELSIQSLIWELDKWQEPYLFLVDYCVCRDVICVDCAEFGIM
jgi:hypothetical protein